MGIVRFWNAYICTNWKHFHVWIVKNYCAFAREIQVFGYKVHYTIMNNLIWISQIKPATTKPHEKSEKRNQTKPVYGREKMERFCGWKRKQQPRSIIFIQWKSVQRKKIVYTKYKSKKFFFPPSRRRQPARISLGTFLCIGEQLALQHSWEHVLDKQTIRLKLCTTFTLSRKADTPNTGMVSLVLPRTMRYSVAFIHPNVFQFHKISAETCS